MTETGARNLSLGGGWRVAGEETKSQRDNDDHSAGPATDPASPATRHPPPATRGATMIPMNPAEAYTLLTEYVTDPSLVRHCLAVEAAMRAYARKLGEDEETWGIVGLLHDFDYERWPNAPDHPLKGSEILRARGYPEDVITAILSHADYLADRYPRT